MRADIMVSRQLAKQQYEKSKEVRNKYGAPECWEDSKLTDTIVVLWILNRSAQLFSQSTKVVKMHWKETSFRKHMHGRKKW